MIRDLLIRKPGNETEALSEQAKSGLSALDELVRDRNSLAREVQDQRAVLDRLTLDNSALNDALAIMQQQRDFWMRTNARLEAHLNQLASIMQVMHTEMKRPPQPDPNANIRQIAEKFAPEAKPNAKSVG